MLLFNGILSTILNGTNVPCTMRLFVPLNKPLLLWCHQCRRSPSTIGQSTSGCLLHTIR